MVFDKYFYNSTPNITFILKALFLNKNCLSNFAQLNGNYILYLYLLNIIKLLFLSFKSGKQKLL